MVIQDYQALVWWQTAGMDKVNSTDLEFTSSEYLRNGIHVLPIKKN